MSQQFSGISRGEIVQSRIKIVYSDVWVSRFKRFTRNRYHQVGDWEGWFEEALQNLALKIYDYPEDRELNDGLIFTIYKNELTTVKRQKLGHPRPRKWLKEYGGLGEALFDLICIKGVAAKTALIEVLEMAKANQSSIEPREQFSSLAKKVQETMIEKKECEGARAQSAASHSNDGGAIDQLESDTQSGYDDVSSDQIRTLISVLLGDSIDVSSISLSGVSVRLKEMKDTLISRELITDMDRYILRSYYFANLSQNDIAESLGLPLQQVVRRRQTCIRNVREVFIEFGFSRNVLLESI